jgi:hypothetical protein
MRSCFLAAWAALALIAGPARADPPAAAKAGLEALSRGDNDAAVRLFSEALLYGGLARSGRELVYVKRSEALLAMGRTDEALADARRALALNPADAEAVEVRNKSQPVASTAPAALAAFKEPSDPLNAGVKARLNAIESRNKAAFETYQAQMADYHAKVAAIEAEKKSNDEAYAASLAAHQAEVEALKQKHAADMADWERRVQACKSGDRSQCAPSPPAGAPAT